MRESCGAITWQSSQSDRGKKAHACIVPLVPLLLHCRSPMAASTMVDGYAMHRPITVHGLTPDTSHTSFLFFFVRDAPPLTVHGLTPYTRHTSFL